MAVRALRGGLLVNNDGLVRNQARLHVTLVASNVRVPAREREVRAFIVIKSRGNPPLGIVAVRARRLASFHKLARVHVFMTSLARLGGAFELHFFRADWYLVASPALHGAVRAQQRELRFRVIKAVHVRPGSRAVAGLASERRVVGARLCHAVFEFPVMHVFVTSRASHVRKVERQDLIGPSSHAHLVTI